MKSERWLLGEFNPFIVIVLLISLIYFWHLVFCNFFFMFPWIFFCFYCCHMTVSSLIKYTYRLVWRVFILFLFHFWLTFGLSYSLVHSHFWHDNWSFHCSCCFPRLYITCQTIVNYVHGHEFLILCMISFEIIYSFENKTYLLHCVVVSSSISFVLII